MTVDHKPSFDANDPTASLRADCARAVEILLRMTSPENGGTAAQQNDILPLDYITRCKGISFIDTKQGGLGVSVSRGRGFTIQRLDDASSKTPSWSGPCFVNVTDLGIGLTVGYNQIATVVILGNQAAVDKVKKNEPTFMVDGSLILGKDSAITGTREDGLTAIPFSLADGALVDLSFKGGAAIIHTKKNQSVYGNGITAEGILDGKVPAPPEFQPLYAALAELIAKPTRPDE